jgi:hypothetical protein
MAPRHNNDGSNDLVLIPRWHQRLTASATWRRPPSSTRLDGPSIATFLDLRASWLWRRSSQLRRGLLEGSTKVVLAQASQGGATPPRQRRRGRRQHRLLKQWRRGLLKVAAARAPSRQWRRGLVRQWRRRPAGLVFRPDRSRFGLDYFFIFEMYLLV